ncbi:RmlC-like cupin [Lentithecium fluviatile CBS 122367]|uniref:Mannose-6-phosphate isomerase n=1 Tax=Lentithecium fluviatile CBS 122367 TaxID=1168545 RepID=A0A6G1JH16_9PLEO|nr:RmlC-like cupin [Lentithecium fluviatile CBS 122367]
MSIFSLLESIKMLEKGKQGSNSLAATLCSKTPGTDFEIDEDTPYAEMWMGTYPELPSYVLETGEDLQDVLNKNFSELIGQNVVKKFNYSKIPYLPKVLSIAKALPLQVHRNKTLAAELHNRNPDQFTDHNHKPEIALALGDFEAFCGFKPLEDITKLMDLPPLQAFLPQVKKPEFDDQTLKHVTNDALLQLPRESFGKYTYIPELIPRLSKQYDKCDNGTVVALITMNYLQLKAGESIYIPADNIHTYLSGDILSFCPRADRDSIDTFCFVLALSLHDPKEAILPPRPFNRRKNGKTQEYAPPLSEFSILGTEVGDGESERIGPLGGLAISIVTKGEGAMKVSSYFIGQGVKVSYEATKALQIYVAFVE